MLRNLIFTLAGIGIYIVGGVTGPHIWDMLTKSSTQTPVVEAQKQDETSIAAKPEVVAEKDLSIPEKKLLEDLSAQIEEKKAAEVLKAEELTAQKALSDGETAQGTEPAHVADGDVKGEDDIHTPSGEEDADAPAVTNQIIEAKIEAGDSLLVIFEDYTETNAAYNLVNIIEKEISAKSFRVGQPYLLEYDAEKNRVLRFEYEINSKEKLFVTAEGDSYTAKVDEIVYDKKLFFVEGTIDDSLFLTVQKLNESPQLAMTVANMFRWDINFIRDVQSGDSFSILVEKLYRDGEFKGYGRTLGATFINSGKKYESFLYYDANKKEMHYNAKGENLRKVLLQSPLSFTRVTSGYTHSRKHPVYGTYRPHLGIDYGAPMGTPIMAVGDGTITYYGWRGGYGKHITVKHASGLESMYSHMSRYGRGLKKGSKVRQGQVIGYVGSTGVSTGPHLDFRLKQNGNYINPSKAINPRAEAVSKVHKVGYETRKELVREFMDGTRTLESYDPKSIDVPKS